jgi:large subunit ribosomal protein L7/L12
MENKSKTVVEEVIEGIEKLNLIELNELTTKLKEKHGLESMAVAAPAVAVSSSGTGNESSEKEEKTHFDVVLKSAGSAKLKVIKAINAITGQGLKVSKELADNVPSHIKKGVDKKEAERIKGELEEAGGEVTIE